MQKTSPYVDAVPGIVADMEREREQDEQNPPAQEGEQPERVLYRYRTASGGVVLSNVPLEEDAPPPIVDSQDETDQRPRTRRPVPLFVHFLLLLFLFVSVDNLDTVFAQLAPTVTVTIQPVVKTISTTGSLTIGQSGAQVQGRVLPALTLSQEQTVKTTGRGHQDATRATGTLTYFNGSFSPQTIPAGTTYTGADGVQVATIETVTIPAANPPYVGQASVTAYALVAGTQGNIQAGDIAITTNTLQMRNNQFQNGKDARDFTTVAKQDIDQLAGVLKAQVTESMQAALQGQLRIGEQLLSLPCAPVTSTNHNIGDEAQSVMVNVSETCSGIAYDPVALQTAAERILSIRAGRQLGKSYQLNGQVQLHITSATPTKKTVIISFRLQGTWVYQISEAKVKALVAGKPRILALHLLEEAPGVRAVSIAGVGDNSELPTDMAHIHIVFLSFLFPQ